MRPRRFNDPGHFHFVTFSCYHKHQFLIDRRTCESLCDAIDRARQLHKFLLNAYVFMPDHVHSISNILRDVKLPIAQRLIRRWRREAPAKLEKVRTHQGSRVVHRIWQAGGGYDRNLRDLEAVAKAIDYIEWNPVRRRLVREPLEWVWSSARARQGEADVPLIVDPVKIDGKHEL